MKNGKKRINVENIFKRYDDEPRMRNSQLLRRGGYSIAITALLVAALIAFNWLVAALAQRFHLEFDLSRQKENSISKENIDYIESIETPVTVTICASENDYSEYMSYYAQNWYNATGSADYFDQTVKLVNRYAEYNKNIKVRYIDPQSTEFTEIATKYQSDGILYGDIIVSSEAETESGTSERHKTIRFDDIYATSDESGYAAAGYGSYTISGNKIETALTGGIAFVLNGETKSVYFLTGHSPSAETDGYRELLKDNNYTVNTVSDKILASLPEDCDVAVIFAPTVDFTGEELGVLSEFLDNGGKLGKSIIFFGDASSPALTNLYDFLSQWGIKAESGILFETNVNNHIEDEPATMGVYAAGDDKIADDNDRCIIGYNIPITAADPVDSAVEVTGLIQTTATTVKAPVGAAADWHDYTDDDLTRYLSAVQAKKSDFDDDNNLISSYIMAFSSTDYINSEFAEYQGVSNKNVALACTDRASGVEDSGISFVSKVITNESYSDKITASGVLTVQALFMIIIPIATVGAGIYVFVRRRRSK